MISFEKVGKMCFSPFLTQQLNNYYILERLFSTLKKWVWKKKKTWTWEKKGREMPMIIYLPPTITPLLQILFLLVCTTYVRNSCDHLKSIFYKNILENPSDTKNLQGLPHLILRKIKPSQFIRDKSREFTLHNIDRT